jgi:hypothetical protein
LANRFGLLPFGIIQSLERERDIPKNRRQAIKEKFEELVAPQLFYEHKVLLQKQNNHDLSKQVVNSVDTKLEPEKGRGR